MNEDFKKKRVRIIVKVDVPNDMVDDSGIQMDKVKHYIEEALKGADFDFPCVTDIMVVKRK